MVGGWMVHHVRRSDLALQQGHGGWPDIFAVHPERCQAFAAELKSASGRLDPLQSAWLDAMRACGLKTLVVRPDTYDDLVAWLVGDRLLKRAHA